MNKTYITTMPNHIGAFLKASECLASLGINITRVSYNKAIDSHMLFIDAEGDEDQLKKADEELNKIGYLLTEKNHKSIVLVEFMLNDIPGSVTEVLRLIDQYKLNISYISSQENGSDYQAFKMGLFVEEEKTIEEFLKKAQEICPVRVIDYNHSEKVFDNSIFYQSFVSGLMKLLNIKEKKRNELLVNSNLIMQMLDEKGVSSYKTFESISKFAELLSKCRGDNFSPRISKYQITDKTNITVIEPPCGSNTVLIQSKDEVLFIDSGYALYKEEMIKIFRKLLPLELEYKGDDGFREQNPLHKPYVNICKTLTLYNPPKPDVITTIGTKGESQENPIEQIGFFDFGELHFEVYQGMGGHLPGETVLIDYQHKIAFTGDIYVNMHGMTREQAAYNQYAPVLMTSVDTDPALCAKERGAVMQRLGTGEWKVFGAHGAAKELHIAFSDD